MSKSKNNPERTNDIRADRSEEHQEALQWLVAGETLRVCQGK